MIDLGSAAVTDRVLGWRGLKQAQGLDVTVTRTPEGGWTVKVADSGHGVGAQRVLPPPECPACWSAMRLDPETGHWRCCQLVIRLELCPGVTVGEPLPAKAPGRFDVIEIDSFSGRRATR